MDLEDPKPPEQKCTSKTAAGKRCRNRALPGLKKCGVHSASAKAKSSAGRPHTITEERTAKMESMLKQGSVLEVALGTIGIPLSTHHEWMKKGRDEAGPQKWAPYRAYAERIDKARALGEDNLVRTIADAAVDDWKAAAWLLERGHPDRWGKRSVNAQPPPAASPTVKTDQPALGKLIAGVRGRG